MNFIEKFPVDLVQEFSVKPLEVPTGHLDEFSAELLEKISMVLLKEFSVKHLYELLMKLLEEFPMEFLQEFQTERLLKNPVDILEKFPMQHLEEVLHISRWIVKMQPSIDELAKI